MRSPHADAFPLVLTHGWPGSVVEFLKVIGPLTDPTAHGGDAADAFHVVCPSLPGYGFSDKPSSTGWNVERIGAAWAELMARLGYERYGAQGGDWGAFVTTSIGDHDPEHVAGIHVNLPILALDASMMTDLTEREQASLASGAYYARWGVGVLHPAGVTAADPRATGSTTRPRSSARGWSRSSGTGPTATAIPRTCWRATSCSTT